MTAALFTIEGYRSLITAFLAKGYRTVGYSDFQPKRGALLLRHDVDYSLEHAVRMAEVNADLGVSATFFVLVTGEQYNLASAQGRKALAKIVDAGQWIGLHFDATAYDAGGDIDEPARRECVMLASFSGRPVEAISFHRPVKSLHGLKGPIASRPHAYEPRFFSDIEYCSDSRGAFHYGSPLEREAFRETAPFQLVLHPIWWMRDEALSPVETLLDLRARRESELTADLGMNCEPFAKYLEQRG
jgi:hypothetical protein